MVHFHSSCVSTNNDLLYSIHNHRFQINICTIYAIRDMNREKFFKKTCVIYFNCVKFSKVKLQQNKTV